MANATCPFCSSPVDARLVSYGGTCPRCFAEIPGDEAPTDPGAAVRAAQERWDRFRARIRLFVAFGMLFTLVGCTGLTALVVVLWPEPAVAEVLDFDTLDIPIPDIVSGPAMPLTPAPNGSPAPAADPQPVAASPKPVKERPEPGRPEPVAAAPAPAGTPQPPGRIQLDLTGPRVRRDDNTVLSDPDAVRLMVGERLVEYIPVLQICYERRLKVDPDLRGRWLVEFSVLPDGSTTDVRITGQDKRDSELEACIQNQVESRWKFGKIKVTQPVRRTVRFNH